MTPYHLVDIRIGFRPQKDWAVFLDRDGTINIGKEYVHELKEFKLIEGAATAIKRLNGKKIPVVIIHNASAVGKGYCPESRVQELHQKMKKLLGKEGAFVDLILYCPHRSDAFSKDYAYDCEWRKPKAGMLEFASQTFGFNLKKSYIVGDSFRDVNLAHLAGSHSVLLRTGHAGKDGSLVKIPHQEVLSIKEAASYILKKYLWRKKA